MAEARVANIIEYNKKAEKKLEPIVVVIDEFADLADQLETKRRRMRSSSPCNGLRRLGAAEAFTL